MKLDKQTENNAQLFFRNVIEETGFIDKLRSVTQVIKGRLSQHDTRNAEKIVYPYEYLFTVILLAGMAGFKTKDEVRLFWRTNSDFFSKVFPDLFGYIPSTSTITRAQRIIEHSVMGDVIKDIMSRHYNLVRMCRKIYATEVLSMRDALQFIAQHIALKHPLCARYGCSAGYIALQVRENLTEELRVAVPKIPNVIFCLVYGHAGEQDDYEQVFAWISDFVCISWIMLGKSIFNNTSYGAKLVYKTGFLNDIMKCYLYVFFGLFV